MKNNKFEVLMEIAKMQQEQIALLEKILKELKRDK